MRWGEESLTARESRGLNQSWNTRTGERGKEGKYNCCRNDLARMHCK